MPSIDKSFFDQLHDDYKKFPCFIETGTHNGNTTFSVEPYFNIIYTIEISKKYYNNTKAKYTGDKIKFLLGDSTLVFSTLLPLITDRSIFFLDGHYSCGDTGKGEKDCPLIEELIQINDLFQNEAILIIDDYRLFGKNINMIGLDWSDITKDNVLKCLQSRITQVYHLESECGKDDRLVIHIKEKTPASV